MYRIVPFSSCMAAGYQVEKRVGFKWLGFWDQFHREYIVPNDPEYAYKACKIVLKELERTKS